MGDGGGSPVPTKKRLVAQSDADAHMHQNEKVQRSTRRRFHLPPARVNCLWDGGEPRRTPPVQVAFFVF